MRREGVSIRPQEKSAEQQEAAGPVNIGGVRERAMKSENGKKWVLVFLAVLMTGLGMAAGMVIWIDPLFHYHPPLTDRFFYVLDHERSINDGITRNFRYTGMITGTSMTENFKTSEAEALFGESFIKVPSFNSGYREINEITERALRRNPDLKLVIRGVDLDFVLVDKDSLRYGESFFPTYLYDDDPLNDIRYVLNRDILFSWTCGMLSDSGRAGYTPGITSFDEYAIWYQLHTFGREAVCPEGLNNPVPGQAVHLTEEERRSVLASCRQNLTDLADQYADVDFYFFIPPYSLAWWAEKVEDGTVYRLTEAEEILMEEILRHPNIRLFSWNDRTEITSNLEEYKDRTHYGPEINSLMLAWMRDGTGLMDGEHYEAFLERERNLYLTFDYASMME